MDQALTLREEKMACQYVWAHLAAEGTNGLSATAAFVRVLVERVVEEFSAKL